MFIENGMGWLISYPRKRYSGILTMVYGGSLFTLVRVHSAIIIGRFMKSCWNSREFLHIFYDLSINTTMYREGWDSLYKLLWYETEYIRLKQWYDAGQLVSYHIDLGMIFSNELISLFFQLLWSGNEQRFYDRLGKSFELLNYHSLICDSKRYAYGVFFWLHWLFMFWYIAVWDSINLCCGNGAAVLLALFTWDYRRG